MLYFGVGGITKKTNFIYLYNFSDHFYVVQIYLFQIIY